MGKRSDTGMPLFDRLVEAEVDEERAERADASRPGDRDQPLTVSQALKAASTALERQVGVVWIEGEACELSRSSAGHVYFTLRDDRGQLNAILWRSDAQRVRFKLEEGLRLLCRGAFGIYETSGRMQFYVRAVQPAGVGEEALAFEQLRQTLAAEGLFDATRKRPLPRLPRRIGLVTSRTGAALRDIIRVVHRRFPVPMLLAPTQVQGPDAPRQIVFALQAIARQDVDLVIVGRGGGSAQDLSAFNDERVVRAVAACPIPTIAAVGHEVDVTLTGLAADRRAATPSQAGELAVPVLADLSESLRKAERRLAREVMLRLRHARQDLERLTGAAEQRLTAAIVGRRRALAELETRVEKRHPRAQLAFNRAQLTQLEARGTAAVRRRCERAQREMASLGGRLHAMSPLSTLDRGYAIARAGDAVITAAAQVSAGDELEVVLASGRLDCRVEQVRDEKEADPPSDD
jgi:exodeoxyribonuclease VII large subunit